MATEDSPCDEAVSLLQLPDPCLLAVLRCCAEDPRSVCSAARAHSRLHQAAVLALASITIGLKQQQLDNLLEAYLPSHGQHVDSIGVTNIVASKAKEAAVALRQLPPTLTKLSSLTLENVHMQLQPSGAYEGVLSAAASLSLKQLRLDGCTLLDGEEGLAAALAMLPGLQHLAVVKSHSSDKYSLDAPLSVIPGLQQLTHLELDLQVPSKYELEGDEQDQVDAAVHARDAFLQHLTALTHLVDLRLSGDAAPIDCTCSVTASMLSGAQHLTRLELTGDGQILLEPAALAGRNLLQHLHICLQPGGAAGTAQLWCELQQLQLLQLLQQLTCLVLFDSLVVFDSPHCTHDKIYPYRVEAGFPRSPRADLVQPQAQA